MHPRKFPLSYLIVPVLPKSRVTVKTRNGRTRSCCQIQKHTAKFWYFEDLRDFDVNTDSSQRILRGVL